MLALDFLAWIALAGATAAPSGPGVNDRTVIVDERVTVNVPAGFNHDQTHLGENGRLLTVTDGRGALLLTIYNGDKPPSRAQALTVHTEELRRKVAGSAPRKLRERFVGASRPARELFYSVGGTPHTARVVATRKLGKTVVALWSWPSADERTRAILRAVVEAVSLQ